MVINFIPLGWPKPDEQDKNFEDSKGRKQKVWHNHKLNSSIQHGYDSELSESMPNPSSELTSDVVSDASSCIQDDEEGIARKPNVFKNFRKITTSERKTANDSDYVSQNNPKVSPRTESYNNGNVNNSIELNSSWEVVEGSSIIMEVESSFKTESMASKRNQTPVTNPMTPDPWNKSQKSSESHTATFTSNNAPKGIKGEEAKNQDSEKKVKGGPFHYGPNSEEEDYDSEREEYSYHAYSKQSHKDSRATPTKTHNSERQNFKESITPELDNSAHHSEAKNPEQDGWIGGGNSKKVPQSVNGNIGKRINDSPSSSQQFESMSTHTSPQFQAHPKLLKQQKKPRTKYMGTKDFKGFIQHAKQQIISEKPAQSKDRKRWKSPLTIVGRLVDDAQQRIKNKKKNEPLGRDTPFAHVYQKWEKNLRTQTPQPPLRNKYMSNSSLRSGDSRAGPVSIR